MTGAVCPVVRPAARAGGAAVLAALVVLVSSAAAQPPKDPPPSADEQKAREAFQAGKFDDALKSLQAAAKANPAVGLPKVVLSQWFLQANAGEQARLVLEQAASAAVQLRIVSVIRPSRSA